MITSLVKWCNEPKDQWWGSKCKGRKEREMNLSTWQSSDRRCAENTNCNWKHVRHSLHLFTDHIYREESENIWKWKSIQRELLSEWECIWKWTRRRAWLIIREPSINQPVPQMREVLKSVRSSWRAWFRTYDANKFQSSKSLQKKSNATWPS